MKVMKFGGTSVGSSSAMLRVKQIVESQGESTIVVVSALGGITDKLINTSLAASLGDSSYLDALEQISKAHIDTAVEAVPRERIDNVLNRVNMLLDELTNIFSGVALIKDLSAKTKDTIMSYGERLSSVIIAGVIEGAVLADSRDFIKTRRYYNKHIVDFEVTDRLVKETFKAGERRVVVSGFISSDIENGDITNLGRGGSDYTASIIASALEASILEIWTDVDGFMTADPKVISNAYLIEEMTFVEAMELCNFGAKVIYPPTIFPVYHKAIPIIVKNTFNPDSPGTLISNDGHTSDDRNIKSIKGISSVCDTCLLTVRGLGMVGVIGVNYRIFKALANAGISVFFVSQAASENTTSIGVRSADADLAVTVLSEEFRVEIEDLGEIDPITLERDLATVAIVGENMRHTPGIAGKLFGTLGRNGINVIACAQGASETNISFVISVDNLRKATNVIHDSFFLSEYQVLNIFIAGVGGVGRSLLEQIRLQQDTLKKNNSLQIKVVGIADEFRYIVDREGIDLAGYHDALAGSVNVTSSEILRDEILGMNIFNSVFVDCTASSEVASIYQTLLDSNVSVVAANKVAASSEYKAYRHLKQTSRAKGVKFLFETNVGAGLPIINTINNLINSGDRILKIEAVVSGTLNYIFNEMSENISMSKAIMMAREAGYAEPDPRIDLSGMDVIRKLVILAREAGYAIEQDDVKKELFIPEEYFEGSLNEFWTKITGLDEKFEAERRELAEKGLRWRFIAELDNGNAKVSLQKVDAMSPFYNLAGSNNVISLTTERYREYPMQIKGYGAGVSVTAAGVFADIISIANIR